MTIDENTIRKISHLARLEFEEDKKEGLIHDLNKIIHWMEKLSEVDTEAVEPLTHMSEEVNVLREDVVMKTISHEEGLKNAPKKDSDYFRVPKVIE